MCDDFSVLIRIEEFRARLVGVVKETVMNDLVDEI